MDASFWHKRWENNRIGFHESKANPLLVQNFRELSLVEGSRIFVPLCGKTLDIAWFLSQGYRVAGAELSQKAIEQLFMELGVDPIIAEIDGLYHYHAPNIDIFVGDIFQLSQQTLGSVDGVYDRAALVALPTEMRHRYATHLMAITNKAPQLLISFEYDQQFMHGPPFSVTAKEINQCYGRTYDATLLVSQIIPNGFKTVTEATENVWLLQNNE